MPGRYDRLTVNASSEATISLLARFRKLVGPRNINRTLLQLIEQYVNQKGA